jgi:formylglycine-generating enzyme required for sulfatase activity
VIPEPPTTRTGVPAPDCAGWPFDAAEARRRQKAAGGPTTLVLSLAEGVPLELVRIPGGDFIMGQADGCPDESPPCHVRIPTAFWMGRFEVTNEQFALFDPSHHSRLEHGDYIQFSPGERGWTLSRSKQPVVRVSWEQARAFCSWLSKRTGLRFMLPTEAQWEYACRAGTATPLWYGTLDTDFSRVANVSDATHQAIDPFGWSGRPEVIPPWRPADTRFNDHSRVSAPAGTYEANPWGLHDMHGNVAEWTLSAYRPYPCREDNGRNEPMAEGRRTVRGGSWYDRPDRCRSAFRQGYVPEQGVYDVGFRVICEHEVPAEGPRETDRDSGRPAGSR